jgi:hypothetical protein
LDSGNIEVTNGRLAKRAMIEKSFQCPIPGCSKWFPETSILKRHFRKHTKERPYKCQFEGCDQSFADGSNCRRHELIHSGEKPYKCPISDCDRSFSRGCSLKKHMINIHDLPSNDLSIVLAVRKVTGLRRIQATQNLATTERSSSAQFLQTLTTLDRSSPTHFLLHNIITSSQ